MRITQNIECSLHFAASTSSVRTTFKANKATLLIFSVAVLLASSVAAARGQSADGFDPNPDSELRSVAVQADGKVLLGGYFTTLSPNGGAAVPRNRIARLNPDGTLDTAFDPNADGQVNAIVVEADGKVLVGGSFTTIGGQPRNSIARLDATTGLPDSFNPNPNAGTIVNAIVVQADGKILVGGFFDSIGGQTRNFIARLDPATGLADSWDPNANQAVWSIAVQPDGKILVGGYFNGTNSIGGQMRNYIARLDATTGLADSFNPNANSTVYAIAAQADGKILAGGTFTSIGGQARNRMARLDATTGLADSFDPNADISPWSIVVQPDGKILVGGYFHNIGGQMRNYIARLDATTGLADSWDPAANNIVQPIAVQGDGKILAGGAFSRIGGRTRNCIARLEASPATPTTIIVTNTNDSGSGSLRQALAGANRGDSIQFDTSLNGQTITLTSAELAIYSDISIIGPGSGLLTVSRSSSAAHFRIFHVMPLVTASIVGLTIRNGDDNLGGGIFNDFSAVILNDCTVRDNIGGGIINIGFSSQRPANLTILNSAIINNSGSGIVNYTQNGNAIVSLMNSIIDSNGGSNVTGGGIHCVGGSVYVTNSSITNNIVENGLGGGIWTNEWGAVTITNSTIKGNTGDAEGGGIWSSSSILTIIGSTISDNSTFGSGGGIFSYGTGNVGGTTIINSTISGNAAFAGGGIAAFAGGLAITNSTLSGNTATDGGGILVTFQAGIILKNTILKRGMSGSNIFNDSSATITSHGYNLSDDNGGGFLMAPGDQVNTNPILGPLQDNGGPTFTHALLPGSPAINAGDPSFTPPPNTDQRGYARVYNGRVDVGSFEAQPTPTPSCVLGSGYWMNHPQAWCMETIQIGCVTYTQTQAIAVMRHNAARDKTYNLAEQLIAAKLNILCRGADPSCVSSAIAAADSWLCDHPVGSGVSASDPAWRQIKTTYNAIANYNDGKVCAPRCNAHD